MFYPDWVRSFLVGFFRTINNLLLAPQKVIWLCLTLGFLNLVLDGSLLRLWSLYRDQIKIQADMKDLERQNADLKLRLKRAKDPAFLEQQARDKFDLVSEGDLVFVFSEEEESPN